MAMTRKNMNGCVIGRGCLRTAHAQCARQPNTWFFQLHVCSTPFSVLGVVLHSNTREGLRMRLMSDQENEWKENNKLCFKSSTLSRCEECVLKCGGYPPRNVVD